MDIPNYHEELQKALKEASESGRVIRRVFRKDEFLRQFPEAANDPRMAVTNKVFVLNVTPLEALTVGELRQLCKDSAIKDSSLAKNKLLSVIQYPDSQIVRVHREELDQLRTGELKSTIVVPESIIPPGGLALAPSNIIDPATKQAMEKQSKEEAKKREKAKHRGGMGSNPNAKTMTKDDDLVNKPEIPTELEE